MNRRDFLKLAGVSLLSLAALTMGCGSFNAAKADAPAPKVKQSTSEGASQNMNNGKKILVAYFSWSGNTKAVAEEIHKQVGGDIVEIVPATPYSETYSVTVAKAKAEQAANAPRPAFTSSTPRPPEAESFPDKKIPPGNQMFVHPIARGDHS